MNETPTKDLGGRPTLYKPEYCEQLITHMAEGLSYESFAGIVGASEKTLYNWENAKNETGELTHPEWLEAKERAFALCRVFWERAGRNMMLGIKTVQKDAKGVETELDFSKGNATVWIFNMKNRFNWRDKVDHTSDNKPMRESVVIQLPSNGREKE